MGGERRRSECGGKRESGWRVDGGGWAERVLDTLILQRMSKKYRGI